MDIERLVEKIEEYMKENNDKYGFHYVKDLVRMAIYYEKIEDLMEDYQNLIKNNTVGLDH